MISSPSSKPSIGVNIPALLGIDISKRIVKSISKNLSLFFLFILIIQSNIIEGQGTEFIYGKLINSEDKTPISFAHIIIKNKAKGLISNIDGGFKIPYELQKSGDTLVISSIGYSSKEIPLSILHKNLINLITLVVKTEILDEVQLIASKKEKRRNAQEIVQLALDKIPENFPFIPFSYVGYYRDYQIKEGKYLNLNEALMQVFDSGFGVYDSLETQTRIYQYKNNPIFPTDTIAAMPYDYTNRKKIVSNAVLGSSEAGRNEYTLLRIHDALRNYNINSYGFVYRLDLNFVNNHKLKLLPVTFIDNIPLYSIDIYKSLENSRVAGKIFISKGDFKIYKMQYAVYDKRKSLEAQKKLQTNSNLSKTMEKNIGKLVYEIIVEYQSHKGIMYPNYISFNNSFEILQPPKFFPIDAEINYTEGSTLTLNSIELTFNNTPLLKDAMKKRNYRLGYKDLKLKIDSIKVKKNIVLLYLNKKIVFNPKRMQSSSKFVYEDATIKVQNIKDIYGNVLHQQEYASYNQFREFFVQELKINSKKPLDNLYMLKNEHIFKNQPIAPFKNLDDYWMNTPLKN